MRSRRHHNNTGYRKIQRGKTTDSLEEIAKRVFRKKVRKISGKLFVKEDTNG